MTLALGGIAVVLGAVFASMGFLAVLGLPSSLIILEVVPFLVLAVGADNIFIFVQEYQVSGHGGPHGAGGHRDTLGTRGHLWGWRSLWGRWAKGHFWGRGSCGAWRRL